jgi:hypothetical protein
MHLPLCKPIRLILTVFITLACFITTFAQKKAQSLVTGFLVDSLNKEPMANASVSVISLKDSSIVNIISTNTKGVFLIDRLQPGSYKLTISFLGYYPVHKLVTISSKLSSKDFGTIIMVPKITNLKEVTIEPPPVEVKKDTIEFRASAFKTAPDATAEDLLKKLPGIAVARDGSVKASGEDVSKIYVDGKEFFSNDPKIATHNITADMIESVQVYNDMSEQAKFTKIDDGSRSKTINIKLKKNRQKGTFGKLMAGYGTDNRYQAGLNYNSFKNSERISIISGSNNLNDQSFSGNDRSVSNGGIPGINTSSQYGVNYINSFGTKWNVTATYLHQQSKNQSDRTSILQSFFPADSSAINSSQGSSVNNNRFDRISLKIEYAIDSNNSVLYTPYFNLQNTLGDNKNTSSTHGLKEGVDRLDNLGIISNLIASNGINANNNFLYRRRFKTRGRTFSLGYNSFINSNNGNNTNMSLLSFYNTDSTLRRSQNQNIKTEHTTGTNNNVINTSYTEPLTKKMILELNYSYINNKATSDRKAYNFDSLSNSYDFINSQQTNYFKNSFQANKFGLNLKFNYSKVILQAGAAMQTGKLVNINTRTGYSVAGKDSTLTLKQNYTDFFPVFSFTYNLSPSKNLRIYYNGRTQQPSAQQLQNVADVSNPLQIRIGNPLLRQEFVNNINVAYNSFNPSNYNYFSITVSGGKTSNKIVSNIDSVPPGILNYIPDKSVQLNKPINVNGVFNTSSIVTLGIPIHALKGSNLNFTNTIFYNRDISEIYKVKNATDMFSISQTIDANLDFKDKIYLDIKADISYDKTIYSLQKDFNNQYLTQKYQANLNILLFNGFTVFTDYYYNNQGGISGSGNLTSASLNAGISQHVFKKKKGNLKLSANDIFKQNKSITRILSENYISNTKATALTRYFLLTFTYNFNTATKNKGK